ncbi:MAG: DUF4259 domain-containing protein [Gammaproteobacteria bacterium]|nr:DUF4259 domain-containing protein [Gammaproteobacteria bacterium]MDH3373946.1 DUF4259 domain-containing protein [Gammaproteobacteria bacterium]MDH3408442.1 DUF4259 domain-containing protein [Gammaproteobacteria bacterium]
MRRRIIAACFLVWAGSALAGAWDTGSFDNDDALDWIWQLSESNDLTVVKDTLQTVAKSSGYVEAPTASMAIAAAEVVAALRGNPRPDLPVEVSEWVQSNQVPVGDDLLKTARKAIESIKKEDLSELAQLWSESGELERAWQEDLKDLLQRLQ